MSDDREMNHIDRACLIIMSSFFLVFLSPTRGEPHFITALAVFTVALGITILQLKNMAVKWYYRCSASVIVLVIS